MNSVAIITAGGIGSRTNQNIPKQFLSVNDKPIILYTLLNFQNHPNIDKIVVVCLKGWEEYLLAHCKQYNITKLYKIVEGGETNFLSIKKAFDSIKSDFNDNDILIVHDGNRPCTNYEIIDECINVAKRDNFAVSYLPTNEVVYEIINGKQKELNRDNVFRTQTPHAVKFKICEELLSKVQKDEVKLFTGFCSLFSHFGYDISFVRGSEKNFKITYKDDIDLFKGLVKIGGVNENL